MAHACRERRVRPAGRRGAWHEAHRGGARARHRGARAVRGLPPACRLGRHGPAHRARACTGANGSPIRAIDVFSCPEWSAIVVTKDSQVSDPAQLRGQKIAATQATDPYFFLLQTLAGAGLSAPDVEIVNLQHSDGKIALEGGDVAAWAGLDPFMAQTELEAGSRLIYRNLDFNSYGLLNANEEFLEQEPQVAQTVVTAYERALAWITENPDAAVQTLAAAAGIKPEIARQQLLTRTDLGIDPVPGEPQRAVLSRMVPLLVTDGLVRSEQEATTALATLFEPRFAEQAKGTTSGGRAARSSPSTPPCRPRSLTSTATSSRSAGPTDAPGCGCSSRSSCRRSLRPRCRGCVSAWLRDGCSWWPPS